MFVHRYVIIIKLFKCSVSGKISMCTAQGNEWFREYKIVINENLKLLNTIQQNIQFTICICT